MKKQYLIKIWETEEEREEGISSIIETNITDLKKAIEKAKKIMEEQQYASLEVQTNNEQETLYFATPDNEQFFYQDNQENENKSIESIVDEYFNEYDISKLIDYGSDRDSHNMPTMTQMYKDIFDKLNIKYQDISTEDISDGKYKTNIKLEDENELNIYTDAWNDKKVVTDNIKKVCEVIEQIEEYSSSDDMEM